MDRITGQVKGLQMLVVVYHAACMGDHSHVPLETQGDTAGYLVSWAYSLAAAA